MDIHLEKSSNAAELKLVVLDRVRMLRQQHRQTQCEPKKRRRSERRPFRYTQRIAAYIAEMPKLSDYYPVECWDISTTGISFKSPEEPSFRYLVVELGASPKFAYITARIVRTAPQSDGTYIIGCEFLKKITG